MEVAGANALRWPFCCRGSRREEGMALSTLGGYTFMKTTLTALLSSLLLCGCLHKQAASSSPAINLARAGDTSWHYGSTVYMLHVISRDGTSLQGVTLVSKQPDEQTEIVSADTATIETTPNPNVTDDKTVLIRFHNAKMQVGAKIRFLGAVDYGVVLHE
jgi:hypothetical protein